MSTRRLLLLFGLALACIAPASAQADFGLVPGSTTATVVNKDGTTATQASSHPYAFSLHFALKTGPTGQSEGGAMRDVIVDLPPGLIGNPSAVPTCPQELFEGGEPHCPLETQVGVLEARIPAVGDTFGSVYNLDPPPGVAARFGYDEGGLIAIQNFGLRTEGGYGVGVSAPDLPTEATSVTETIWGMPADPGHDAQRGDAAIGHQGPPQPSTAPKLAFLTLPASCQAPLQVNVEVDSVLNPGVFLGETAAFTGSDGQPYSMSGCEAVPFTPKFTAQPSTRLASSPSGLDFELKLPNQGLLDPGGIVETEPQKIEVALPEGLAANPSAAEGLGTCTEAQYKAEQIDAKPGEGCPEASKIGSIVAHTPLIQEPIEGSLYLAKPYENPSHSLLAIYLVFRVTARGVLIKQAGKVEPDPKTGRLITTLEGLPPLPYSDATLHFREGARAPLVSPPACGEYKTTTTLYPFSAPANPVAKTASFRIERGVDGGPCPDAALPFNPGFEAGSLNNAAGAYSQFNMRLTRQDGDQDLTRFSAKLPPGMIGKLAGSAECPASAIAQARSRTGQNGGQEEKEHPSCPASAQIGTVLAGAGVGPVLTYVPGKIYLAGPYKGAPLSVVAIVPALAGPFDAGTVVTQQALRINPLTAEVEADGSSSDPIPHILQGIPLAVRDIRVYIDKPNFTLNPTSCEPSATKASVWGGGRNVFSTLDDSPFSLASRFQAADCASLGFKPRLALKLKGGTRRGAHPALTGVFRPRPADANAKQLVLTLPHSAFLDQGHIRTICTRVQFAADGGNGAGCPKAAEYGRATAYTPILDEPLEGPVYLRSSDHKLPDFVAALHGKVDVEAVARIDSKQGGIRATFDTIPDAPLSKVVVNMQGGKKGLIVNSTSLCARDHRADARFEGHNGRRYAVKPVVGASCGKGHRSKHSRHRGR